MIRISCKNERFTYDMYHIVKSFLPDAEISQKVDPEQELLIEMTAEEEPDLEEQACDKKVRWTFFHCREAEIADISEKREQKRYINKKLYQTLVKKTGEEHAWGNMTGVRPTKMIMERLEEGSSEEEIIRYMHDTYVVSEKKAMLGIEIAKREKAQLDKLDYENGYSLYIGIPFCPSTCLYCSFTSYPIGIWKKRVDAYLEALFKEIDFVAEHFKDKVLDTIYIGGGTPTSLSADQLDRLLTKIEESLDLSDLLEFTVEAGRPDSITRDKLEALHRHGIGRISINPQTMNQKTLDLIGRHHTVEQVIDSFHLAREVGFATINMDLIVGLPGEHMEDVEHTMSVIKELDPDNLTVHSLAIKRSARLNLEWDKYQDLHMENSEKHMALAHRTAQALGMEPYYLYRQKNMTGNLENIGFAKEGKAGLYNILIMEEKQSIVALGAGAACKCVSDHGLTVTRCENVKDVGLYIERIDEMIERKRELFSER